jgi:hypothetical protein
VRGHTNFKALDPLGKAALHAATTAQHGDAPHDAGRKALAFVKGSTLFECLALGIAFAATLWNGHHLAEFT